MKSVLRRLGIILVAVIVAVGLSASPASANYGCNQGHFCTYWNTAGGGSMYYYTGYLGQCFTVGEPWNDDISSVRNRRGVTVIIYNNVGCGTQGGWSITIPNGGYWSSNIINDNEVSSIKICLS